MCIRDRLLAALPQRQRLLQRGAARLQAADDLDQLVPRLLVAEDGRHLGLGRRPLPGVRRAVRRLARAAAGDVVRHVLGFRLRHVFLVSHPMSRSAAPGRCERCLRYVCCAVRVPGGAGPALRLHPDPEVALGHPGPQRLVRGHFVR